MGSQRMSLRVGVDLCLFHILIEEDGNPISAAELADRCKAELLLIGTSRRMPMQSRNAHLV